MSNLRLGNTESEKHQEPRNQVPEEGYESEEGLPENYVLSNVNHIIHDLYLFMHWRVLPKKIK